MGSFWLLLALHSGITPGNAKGTIGDARFQTQLGQRRGNISIFLQDIACKQNWGWRESTLGRAFVWQAADLGSILRIPYSPLSQLGATLGHRPRSKNPGIN